MLHIDLLGQSKNPYLTLLCVELFNMGGSHEGRLHQTTGNVMSHLGPRGEGGVEPTLGAILQIPQLV